MVSTLVLIYICRPRPRHTIKTNFIKFKGVYPEIYAILICYKRVWDQFLNHSLGVLFQKNIFHVIFSLLTKFQCLMSLLFEILCNMCIAIIHCSVCDVIDLKNVQLSYQVVFLFDQKNQNKNINGFRTKGAFKMK